MNRTSREEESKMFKKVTSVVASVLCASFLLTACSSREKETKNTAKATDKKEKNNPLIYRI